MVGRIALVGLAGLVFAADPAPSPTMLLPGETEAEAACWAARAEVIRQRNRGDPLSWSTTMRAIGTQGMPSWRASLGADIPHPAANRARRAEGEAESRVLSWERIGAARQRQREEQCSRFLVAAATERLHALQQVVKAATVAEQAVEAAVQAGAATRGEALEARAGRLSASVDEQEAEEALQAGIAAHRARFGSEPGPPPAVADGGLLDLPDQELIRRALAADAGLAAASCRSDALAARTTRASIATWTCPASLQAIADYDDYHERGWSLGVQATFQLTAKDDRQVAAGEEAVCAASRRVAAEAIRRMVLQTAGEARCTRFLVAAAEETRSSWATLMADADEVAVADPSLARRRDALRVREARVRLDLLDKRLNHQRAVLTLGQLLEPGGPVEDDPVIPEEP